MIISHIVAMAQNRVIGRLGGMPWHIPADFKFFKATTMGHALIMGRKTFESIGKPLPGRLNIVISRRPPDAKVNLADNLRYAADFAAALRLCEELKDIYGEEVFVAGGGEIYRQTMSQVDRIYLTQIEREVDGDTFYPEFDSDQFNVKVLQRGDDPLPFSIKRLDRKAAVNPF
jgi:dihydrofolate reductase